MVCWSLAFRMGCLQSSLFEIRGWQSLFQGAPLFVTASADQRIWVINAVEVMIAYHPDHDCGNDQFLFSIA